MANYSTLKAAVADVVKTNGTRAITGANLQSVLLSIINSIGGGGYIFKGVATPSTNAGTPDENVFYIGGAGTYANFGTSLTVPVGSIGVFKYNGGWSRDILSIIMKRTLADVVWCREINFDNTNQQVIIGDLLLCNPQTYGTRKTISATTIQYDFTESATTAYVFVYDLSDESYKFVPMGSNNDKQVVIAGLFISGKPSQNNMKVMEVVYCPIEKCYLNGEILNLLVDAEPTQNSDNLVKSGGVYSFTDSFVYERIDLFYLNYLQGSIYSNDIDVNNTNCIYCPIYIPIKGNSTITISNEKQQDGKWWSVRVCFVDASKTYISQAGYSFTNGDWSLNVPANAKYVRFAISLINADGTDLPCTPADIPIDGTKLVVNNVLKKDRIVIESEISDIQNSGVFNFDILKLDYLQGSIYRDNTEPSNTKCIYCPIYFELGENSNLTIKNEKQQDGKWWSVRVCFVDASKTYISQDGYSFVDGTKEIPIPANAKYVRFTISLINADGTDADCTPADIPTDGTQIIVSNITNAYLTLMDELQTEVYSLQKNNKPLPLNSLLGYSFTNMYDITGGQGCACYNGLIFQFINGNEYVYVHDAADGSLIQTITMSNPNQSYHNNNVNFGSIKYDDADEFPLIYASQEAYSENKCIVYRITGSRGNYIMVVVQTINYPSNESTHLYYQNCYIDNKNGYILISGLVNSTYSETANNKIQYLAFTLPPITQSNVTLQISDVLFKSDVFDKMPTTQGGICKNGLLYQTFGVYPPQLLNIYDIVNCKMCYTINLTEEIVNMEPEGIFENNNKIYIVFANGRVYKFL